MTDYLFLFRGNEAMMSKLSPEQMQQHIQKAMAWIDKMAKAGIYKAGEPLAREGKVLRGQKMAVTDGPYAESKDVVSGYVIVKAASLAKATAIAKASPFLECNLSLEIREIRDLHNL
jgi:hypothetical protein